MSRIPTKPPRSDDDGQAYVYVVMVRSAATRFGGPVQYAESIVWRPYQTHRDRDKADQAADAMAGRVIRIPYFDGVPREPEEHPVGEVPR